jgi:hypothetical protein
LCFFCFFKMLLKLFEAFFFNSLFVWCVQVF